MTVETIVPRLIWTVSAQLGEGPAWFEREQALRFVDIKGGRLHRYVPASGARETIDCGGMPSFVLPHAGGGAVIGSRNGIYQLEGSVFGRLITAINMPAHNRTNDATVDVRGRIWLGTMDDEEKVASGAFYCLDEAGLHLIDGEAVVTNGPAMSIDGRILYQVDSANRQIWRCAIGEGPEIESRDLFLEFTKYDGHPDGIVLDSEDCLWVAMWDGWSVRRFSPAGKLLQQVDLPCARVTKIAFGGPDLRTAYVTTARCGLDEDALQAQPLAGSLFAFDAPAAGNILPEAKLPR